jgi:hypothetical protein
MIHQIVPQNPSVLLYTFTISVIFPIVTVVDLPHLTVAQPTVIRYVGRGRNVGILPGPQFLNGAHPKSLGNPIAQSRIPGQKPLQMLQLDRLTGRTPGEIRGVIALGQQGDHILQPGQAIPAD